MSPARSPAKFPFTSTDWVNIHEGGAVGRMKKQVMPEGGSARILEMDPAWKEVEWCLQAHLGYLLSGRLNLEFKSAETLSVSRGEGFYIPEGCGHRASCSRPARIFLIDPPRTPHQGRSR